MNIYNKNGGRENEIVRKIYNSKYSYKVTNIYIKDKL